ncbi:DUF3422 family protein [Blastochloris sulfoviridis]|uniref:DUF3422 domain-containing protein n=1 Tax=Blastochloris sulfoviridis TaxID=50712 RepID=A0A5M6HN59_9HYPH|nr:DUF3422 domain-containing protein [Blastochloris sulfoviridis]KAA5597276.1 DUF3422 domain-containing protein [Blastochloris sulfoviridis]
MTGAVAIGEERTLAAHPLRTAVLNEVHARPFTLMETPRRVLHFTFLTDVEHAQADRVALARYLSARGIDPPKADLKYYRAMLGATLLRWEQHAEFTTYTWDLPSEGLAGVPVPFHPPASDMSDPMRLVPQPGPLLVAADLHLIADAGAGIAPERLFDRTSLARSVVYGGAAEIATDFLLDPAGYIRILVLDRALGPARAGSLVQRLLEIETYRTLALLGLPEAQRVTPQVRRIERALADLTESMRMTEGLASNHQQLDRLITLSSEIEAAAAASSYRFGASRAYNDILLQRLQAVDEQPVADFPTWASFLSRRMAPALRTCQAIADRQADLSVKLARAAGLLRTRVDIDVQRQNLEVLESMNRRSRLQLRLQQTVEGLSIAAVSYYVVGLISYLAKGIYDFGVPISPGLITAAAVPIVVLVLWRLVSRIRKKHSEHEG